MRKNPAVPAPYQPFANVRTPVVPPLAPTLQMKARPPVPPAAVLPRAVHAAPQKATPQAVLRRPTQPPAPVKTIQRRVKPYLPGTLAKSTLVMRDLNAAQMKIVQQLHDQTNMTYTIDEARQIATAIQSVSNKYNWEVKGSNNYVTPDAGVQSVLESFGDPTTDVVKVYDDLANRVRFDVGANGNGSLSASTSSDLRLLFDASKSLHAGFNPFLNSVWTNNLDNYGGAKTGIPLYSVMRSQLTGDFRAESIGTVSLNEVLREVSGRPFEMHHILYKAHYPGIATSVENLMLTQRSESESRSGPGQHELMHKVGAGNHPNKFNVLVPAYVKEYAQWIKAQTGTKLI